MSGRVLDAAHGRKQGFIALFRRSLAVHLQQLAQMAGDLRIFKQVGQSALVATASGLFIGCGHNSLRYLLLQIAAAVVGSTR